MKVFNTMNGVPSSLGGGTRPRLLCDLGIHPRVTMCKVTMRKVTMCKVAVCKVTMCKVTSGHPTRVCISRLLNGDGESDASPAKSLGRRGEREEEEERERESKGERER